MPIEIGSQTVSVDDIENVAVDFTDKLDNSELLTGTPTVVDSTGSADVNIDNVQRNSATFQFAKTNRTVAISKAVLFTLEIDATGTYYIDVTATTDSTPSRRLIRRIKVRAS